MKYCCTFNVGHSCANSSICCPSSFQSPPMEVCFGSTPLGCYLCDAREPQDIGWHKSAEVCNLVYWPMPKEEASSTRWLIRRMCIKLGTSLWSNDIAASSSRPGAKRTTDLAHAVSRSSKLAPFCNLLSFVRQRGCKRRGLFATGFWVVIIFFSIEMQNVNTKERRKMNFPIYAIYHHLYRGFGFRN